VPADRRADLPAAPEPTAAPAAPTPAATVAPQGGSAPTLDGATIDRIREMERRGATRLLERLVDTWMDSSARLVTDAEAALERGDAAALRQSVHTLKSSSANLGAAELVRRCAAIEHFARDDRLTDARADWTATRAEYERVKQSLLALREPATVS
jgi:HPt (histidine-containing phosphotransfer) domain-containing protein